MTLALGQMVPGSGRRVPVGGVEEQAFVGLIQRWAQGDRDALVWLERIERWHEAIRVDPKTPLFDEHETPDQLIKGHGVGLLRSLTKRY